MEAHTNNNDIEIINQLQSKHNLDIAIASPEWNEEKQNYKKVEYFKDKFQYDGSPINDLQLILRNTND